MKPTFRMSHVGTCPRALSAEYLGYEGKPEPEWLLRTAEEGKWHEGRIKDELRADDIAIVAEQEEFVLDYPAFKLVGHIDGIAIDHGKEMLLEVKSMSQFEFDRWMRSRFDGFPHYHAQVQCYMQATGLFNTLYIVKNRSSGYEDRSIVPHDKDLMAHIYAGLETVASAIEQKQLIEATFDPQAIRCQRCRYQHLCVTKVEVSDLDAANLSEAVALWRTGKALQDEGQCYIDQAKLTLSTHAARLDTRRFVHDDLDVYLLKVHRESYEKKELLKLFTPEQLAPALKATDTEQLRVTDMAQDKSNG